MCSLLVLTPKKSNREMTEVYGPCIFASRDRGLPDGKDEIHGNNISAERIREIATCYRKTRKVSRSNL